MIKKLFIAKTKDDTLFKDPRIVLKGDQLEKEMQISELICMHFRKNI